MTALCYAIILCRIDRTTHTARFAKLRRACFNWMKETGVLHDVGLRDTLEPDPGNAGVGSFRSRTVFFFEFQREFSCFMTFKTRGTYVLFQRQPSGSRFIRIYRSHQVSVPFRYGP
jgi:hypothetical protein